MTDRLGEILRESPIPQTKGGVMAHIADVLNELVKDDCSTISVNSISALAYMLISVMTNTAEEAEMVVGRIGGMLEFGNLLNSYFGGD